MRLVSIVIVVFLAATSFAGDAAVVTAGAYLDAMEAGDLDAAERLFADSSSVFERGKNEGNWQHYREHHLGPEVGNIERFAIVRGSPETGYSRDRSMAFVAWPIQYDVDLKDGRKLQSEATVTFVIVGKGESYMIRHVHWSSRRKRTNSAPAGK